MRPALESAELNLVQIAQVFNPLIFLTFSFTNIAKYVFFLPQRLSQYWNLNLLENHHNFPLKLPIQSKHELLSKF